MVAWTMAAALFAWAPWVEGGKPAPRQGLGVVVQGVQKKVRASEGIHLKARVTWRGPKADMRYAWSSEGASIPFGVERDAETLDIDAKDLTPGDRYELTLKVTATYPDPEDEDATLEATAESRVTIAVNAPPEDGACKLSVTWVGPSQAKLAIDAEGWKDDDPLQYRFFVVRNDQSALAYSWSRLSKYQTASLAKPGDRLQAKCEVRDDFGETTERMSESFTRP